MAIAIGSWYAPSASPSNLSTYVSGVFQPSAGTLILAFVEIDAAAYSKPTAINSGHNLVWTEVTSRGGANYGVSIWRAMSAGTSPASGGASICFSSNRTGLSWGFLAITGVPSSSDGSSAIVQYASSSGSDNKATTTLSALSNSDNAVIAAVGIGVNENVNAEAGYTAMSTQPGHANPTARLGVMYQLSSADITPSQSWTSSGGYGQIALELAVDAIATYIRTNRTYGTQDFTQRSRIGEYIRYNSNFVWGMAAVGQTIFVPVATFFRTLAHTVWSGVQPARLRELIRKSTDVLSNTFSAQRLGWYSRKPVEIEPTSLTTQRIGWYKRSSVGTNARNFSLQRIGEYFRWPTMSLWVGVNVGRVVQTLATTLAYTANTYIPWVGAQVSFLGQYVRRISLVPVKTDIYDTFSTYGEVDLSETENWMTYPASGYFPIALLGGTYYVDVTNPASDIMAKNIGWQNPTNTANYRVSARFRIQTTDQWEGFRLWLRWTGWPTEPITGYVLGLEPVSPATLRIRKYVDDQYTDAGTLLATGIAGINITSGYRIAEFQAVGSVLSAFLDKKLILSVVDNDISSPYGAGFGFDTINSYGRVSNFAIGEPYHGITTVPQRIGQYFRNIGLVGVVQDVISAVKAFLRAASLIGANNFTVSRLKGFVRNISEQISQITVSIRRFGYWSRTVQTLRAATTVLSRIRTYYANLVTQNKVIISVRRIGWYIRKLTEILLQTLSAKKIGEYIRKFTVSRGILDIVGRVSLKVRSLATIRAATSSLRRSVVAYIRRISLTVSKAIGLVQSVLGITRRTASTVIAGARSVARVGAYVRRVTRGVVTGFSSARLRELIRQVTSVLKNVSSLKRFIPEFIRSIRQSTAFGLVLTYYARLISSIWSIATTVYRMMVHTTNIDQKDKYSTDTDRKDNYSA